MTAPPPFWAILLTAIISLAGSSGGSYLLFSRLRRNQIMLVAAQAREALATADGEDARTQQVRFDLVERLEAHLATIDSQRTTIAHLQNQLDASQGTMAAHALRLNELESTLLLLRDDRDRALQENADLHTEVNQLTKTVRELRDRVEEVEAENHRLQLALGRRRQT